MASAFAHPAVPIALRLAGGPGLVPTRLLAAAAAASILPDIDALGFFLGVPYRHPLGHRGLTHSLLFAACVGAAGAAAASALGTSRCRAFALLFASAASHGLLDAMTTGGLGIGFFIPFANGRYFLPWRVIEVSPIGVSSFFSAWGARVLASEVVWVWLPALVAGVLFMGVRVYRSRVA